MQIKKSISFIMAAAALTPLMVTAAEANTKVIRTSYNRISPCTVKETQIIKRTRLISKAQCTKRVTHKVAYCAPRTHSFTTTTRTTSMFIPASQLSTAMLVPSKTIVRSTALAPRTTIIKTTTVTPTMVTPVLSSNVVVAPGGETIVYKQKNNGKLKEIGTLKQAVYY